MPWLAAVALAPFWLGGVSPAAQITTSLLLGASLLLCFLELRSMPESWPARAALGALALFFLFAILPFAPTRGMAPGPALLRAWQLAGLFLCGLLARQAVKQHGFLRVFPVLLAGAMVLQGGAELWFLADGKGIWKEVRHYPAGTFANRNHFANWMVMGALFIIGPLVRKFRSSSRTTPRDRLEAGLYLAALLTGLVTIAACGSRGGVLALVAGLVAWGLMLSRAHGAAVGVFTGVALCAALAFAIAGEAPLARFGTDSLEFKIAIWRDSLQLLKNAPLLGTGLGGFGDAFSAVKTFHGEGSILFAENEYLQWVLETGSLGLLAGGVLAVAAVLPLARALRGPRLEKAGLFHGAMAALAAGAVHSAFEFVWHVPANALLASTLLGMAVALAGRGREPKVLPLAGRPDFLLNTALLLVVGGIALAQARAAQKWSVAPGWKERQAAFELWPLDDRRANYLVRELAGSAQRGAVTEAQARGAARTVLAQALAWRPNNWELRLESAWLNLAFGPDFPSALAEARATAQLNPLQPKIPLRFAAVLAKVHPPEAVEFLRSARVTEYEDIREALHIAWLIDPNPGRLWDFTPATGEGLRALAQFADEHSLAALARQARAAASHDPGTSH